MDLTNWTILFLHAEPLWPELEPVCFAFLGDAPLSRLGPDATDRFGDSGRCKGLLKPPIPCCGGGCRRPVYSPLGRRFIL